MVLSTPMRFLIVLFAATTGLLSHGATVSLPLQDGERLTYRVSWAIVPGAGEIRIEAQAEPATGPPRLKITTTTTTRNLARLLLPFDAKAESLFERQTGKLVSLTESSVAREKRESHTVAFDHAARTARYEDTARGEPARTRPFPDGGISKGSSATRRFHSGPSSHNTSAMPAQRSCNHADSASPA